MVDSVIARDRMVVSQILPEQVSDERVCEAMGKIPRELFVPEHLKGVAYMDDNIDIGNGRYLMEPRVMARLLQAASIGPDDIVLDIGCGTGYSTAVMAQLAGTVVALEAKACFREDIGDNLEFVGVNNAVVVAGELKLGYVSEAPYDVIFINGALEEVPLVLSEQLSEGGRLMSVIQSNHAGKGTLTTRRNSQIDNLYLFDAQVPKMEGFEQQTGFDF